MEGRSHSEYEKLKDLIDGYSLDKYFVNYRSFLSNHLGDGIVALFRLGDNLEHLREFCKNYSSKLEPRGGPLHQEKDSKMTLTRRIDDLLGKESHFYFILRHFQDLLKTRYSNNVDDLVAEEFPKLCRGLSHHALHPTIHLGYGLSVKSPTLVCEGLAYLHYTYFPIEISSIAVQNLGTGTKGILEVTDLIKSESGLHQSMLRGLKQPWLLSMKYGSIFGQRMCVLSRNHGDELLKYVHLLKCPGESNELKDWILEQCVAAYLMNADHRNDFFFAHTITCSWALYKIIEVLKSEDDKMRACEMFLCILMAAYVARDQPRLDPNIFLSEEAIQASWAEIISSVLELPIGTDEHVYKVIQVCYEASQNHPEKSTLFKQASLVVRDNPFFFYVNI